jgi:Zn-dependent protease
MLQMLINGQFRLLIIYALVLVIAISLHEFGHAFAADVQGDRTPRLAGRLTLNPLAHLDPIGTLAIVLAGFGWGKPVPFSPPALRNKRAGPSLVALAGPAVNVILAVIAALLLAKGNFGSLVGDFLQVMLYLNIVLAIFNLIPIPPLDGSRLLTLFLPPSKQRIIFFLDQWGFLILIAVVLFVLPRVLFPVVTAIERWLLGLFI